MMELTDRKNADEEFKLPKNIRQIGEPGKDSRVLIEDYTYTFLRQLAEANLTCMKTAVLVGKKEEKAVFVQGALSVEMGQEIKNWFTNEHWRDIFRTIQKWFEGMEVVGWFLANPGFPPALTEEQKKLHGRNFSGKQCVFWQLDVLENEETFYMHDGMGLSPLCGYYIYYEKNDQMQAYISDQKGGAGIEPEGILKDRTTARFRSAMQERREQSAQKKTYAFLYMACTFLIMVILVIGITMINNYDRMESMENTLYQISENLQKPSEGEGAIEDAVEEENRKALASEQNEPNEEGPGEETDPEESDEEDGGAMAEEPPARPEEEAQEVMSQAVQEPERYEVQVGDTLMDICRRKYGTDTMVEDICELNHLEDGNKILVGDIILLP